MILVGLCYLGTDVLQLSILQPPQYITGGITSDAKVKSMKRRKQLPPDLFLENHKCVFNTRFL